MDKILGKGQSGGFLIPDSKIELLIKNKNASTQKQKEHILNSLQSGGQVAVRPTERQRGGALGTLLASIGIPLAMELEKKLFGQGLSVPSRGLRGKGLTVSPKPGMMMYQPPPFIGSWNGSGTKKQFGPRLASRPKQPIRSHFNLRKHLLKTKFKDVPLSNFDLMRCIKYLRVPNFKGIFSRDSKNHLHRRGSCIINLDIRRGPGTHWVATFVADDFNYYFDSFSLPPPQEFVDYAEKLKKEFQYHSGYPIQDINSVRCGYYCLYFLDNNNKSFYQCLKVFKLNDSKFNEKFIKHYFMNKNEQTRYQKLFQRIKTGIGQIKKMKSYCVKEKKKQTECIEASGYKTAKNGRLIFFLYMPILRNHKNKICSGN